MKLLLDSQWCFTNNQIQILLNKFFLKWDFNSSMSSQFKPLFNINFFNGSVYQYSTIGSLRSIFNWIKAADILAPDIMNSAKIKLIYEN
jgi:hypothetical protein